MRKHALFYSERCVHSKAAISLIQRLGVGSLFTFISVDSNRHSIPSVVTCVPTIVTDQRHVLMNDQLAAFIQAMGASTLYQPAGTRGLPSPPPAPTAAASAPLAGAEEGISSMSLGSGTQFSEGFSFIGDPEQCESGFCRGFVFVNEDVRIQHPTGDTDSAARKRSENVTLDQLVSDREKMM
jgi:glutaredoxin